MLYLDKFINREAFLVCGSEDDEEASDLYVTGNLDDLNGYLSQMTPDIDADLRVFHGMLTIAELLPKSFKGKSAFVICTNPDTEKSGCLVESGCTSPETLAEELGSIIAHGQPFVKAKMDIDDYYILYGYQIRTCMAVSPEEIDEEAISTCRKVSDQTELVGKILRGEMGSE